MLGAPALECQQKTLCPSMKGSWLLCMFSTIPLRSIPGGREENITNRTFERVNYEPFPVAWKVTGCWSNKLRRYSQPKAETLCHSCGQKDCSTCTFLEGKTHRRTLCICTCNKYMDKLSLWEESNSNVTC